MIDRAEIFEKLKKVMDPELNIDIVSLGLVYDANSFVDEKDQPHIHLLLTLTTPGCPLIAVFDQLIKDILGELGVKRDNIEIELTFDPPWTPELMSQEAKLTLGYE